MHLKDLRGVKKCLIEAQRVVKKKGFIWIYAGIENENNDGIIDKFLIPSLRKAYIKNKSFKNFIDRLDEKTIKNFINFYERKLNKKDFHIIRNFIKKYITVETLVFIQNWLQVPKSLELKITYRLLKKTLKKCKLKKTPPLKFERKDIRKFLQPFYGSSNKIAKVFYNRHLNVLAQKI